MRTKEAQMKRFLMALALVVLLAPVYAEAANVGTFTVTSAQTLYVAGDRDKVVITAAFLAASADNSVPDLTLSASTYGISGYYLYQVITDPGNVTAPSNGAWDVLVYDAADKTANTTNAEDLCFSAALNRSSTLTQHSTCAASPNSFAVVTGDLVVSVAGNAVASATGTVKLIFVSK
jgi:hypothetical protein